MVSRFSMDHHRVTIRWFLAIVTIILITALLLGGCKKSNHGSSESDSFTYQLTLFEVTTLDSKYEDEWDRFGGQFDVDYESDLSACTIVISPDSVKIQGPSLSNDNITWETIADQKDKELDLPGYVELSDGAIKGRRVSTSSDNVTMVWRDLEAQFDKNKITGTFIARKKDYDENKIDMTSVTFEGIRID